VESGQGETKGARNGADGNPNLGSPNGNRAENLAMIVLLLWLTALIVLVSYESWWPVLFRLEMWIIKIFGRIEEM
jgi:hypothetical protein